MKASMVKRHTICDMIGDGKIFVYSLEQVVRIRTGETGDAAI